MKLNEKPPKCRIHKRVNFQHLKMHTYDRPLLLLSSHAVTIWSHFSAAKLLYRLSCFAAAAVLTDVARACLMEAVGRRNAARYVLMATASRWCNRAVGSTWHWQGVLTRLLLPTSTSAGRMSFRRHQSAARAFSRSRELKLNAAHLPRGVSPAHLRRARPLRPQSHFLSQQQTNLCSTQV